MERRHQQQNFGKQINKWNLLSKTRKGKSYSSSGKSGNIS